MSAGYGDLNSVGPAYTTVASGMLLQVVIIVVFISSRVAVILKQPLFTIHAVLLVPIAVILLIIYKIIDSRVG